MSVMKKLPKFQENTSEGTSYLEKAADCQAAIL